jgi:hypothetical protein
MRVAPSQRNLAAYFTAPTMSETFPIVPGQLRILWALVPLVLVFAALGTTFSGARLARFEVSPAGLRLRGDLYGRLIPTAQLRLDSARAIDLRSTPNLRPTTRTRGTGFPGYQSGWWRLRDGERALLYVTDQSTVVYVPTRDGYSVLLSVKNPEAFLASLRRAAGA